MKIPELLSPIQVVWGGTSSTFTGTTSWQAGKFGSSIYFTGDNSVVRIPETTATDIGAATDSYTVSAWVKTIGITGNRVVVGKMDYNSSSLAPFYLIIDNTNYVCFNIDSGINPAACTPNNTLSTNVWHYLTGVRDVAADKIYLYVDGVLQGSAIDTTTGSMKNNFDIAIGNGGNTYNQWDFIGNIDDVKIYNYARTAGQIIEDMNGKHPIGGSPVGSQIGYWKFDEGYGDAANNSISGKTNGNLGVSTTCPGAVTCPTWTTNGKFNNALTFDGSNTQIQMANNAYTDTQGSISAWIKLAVLPTDGTAFSIYTTASSSSSTNLFVFDVYQPTGLNPRLRIGTRSDLSFKYGDTVLTTGVWYHVVGQSNGSAWSLYVNGKKQELTIQSGTGAGSGYWFGQETSGTMLHTIGALRRSTGTNSYFNGQIDEVKIYNTPLTDDEVKIDYNRGASAVMGSTSTASDGLTADTSQSREFCIPGDTTTCNPPVGWWKMDEGTGSTTYDTSSNQLNGSITSAGWITGVKGSALSVGTGKYVTVTDNSLIKPTSAITVETWFRSTDLTASQRIVSKKNTTGYQLALSTSTCTSSSALCFLLRIGGVDQSVVYSRTNLSNNTWYHVAGTYDGANMNLYVNGVLVSTLPMTGAIQQGTQPLCLGAEAASSDCTGGSELLGDVDNVMIYDYARSPAQVAWDYNRGGPIAHYKFDECSGTTAYNSVLNGNGQAAGNNGTITIGATGSNTSAGTCTGATTEAWKNGANGKINSSLSFDGSNDYVSITDTTKSVFDFASGETMTISAWIKPSSLPIGGNTYSSILAKPGASGNGYYAQISYAGQLEFCIYSTVTGGCYTTTQTPVTTGTWQHVIYSLTVGDSTTIKIYYNGKRYLGNWSDNGNVVPDADNATVYIGATDSTGEFFIGQLDDVRVYRYAPTDAQVKTMMNNNSAVNFAPITGSP